MNAEALRDEYIKKTGDRHPLLYSGGMRVGSEQYVRYLEGLLLDIYTDLIDDGK